MAGCVDLHIHSRNSSDGDHPVERIVRLAREHDLAVISIADHDTTAAYPEAVEWGEQENVEVIPGVELTTLFRGREFHLLLPFADWTSKSLQDLISQVRERRMREARERVDKLMELGYDLTWEEVCAASAPFAPLGVTIAQVLLDKAERTPMPELRRYTGVHDGLPGAYGFYRDYFTEGRPAFVPRRNLSLIEVLASIPETGGVPVLAHPGAEFQRVRRDDLASLKERGLQGLEVYTTYHDRAQTKEYLELAREFDLVVTAGSDFHGSLKPHIPFGILRAGDTGMVEELRRRRP